LFGRSNLASRIPAVANVAISNVPGLPMTLYMAGARMLHYYPVSIPYHGMGLNITVQSYDGKLEFGITACRRVLSQEESHELIGHLQATLEDIRALESVGEAEPAAPAVPAVAAQAPIKAPARKTPARRPRAAKTNLRVVTSDAAPPRSAAAAARKRAR
jgi:diacylglycerol O-acyltransferase / wax synthase